MELNVKSKVLDTIKCILSNEVIVGTIEDIGIVRLDIIGSRVTDKYTYNSDLDILVDYSNDIKECDVFNMLNSLDLEYDGIKIDFFPNKISK